MPTMLKQKGTGDLYVFSPEMAGRPDMEVFDETDLSPVKPKQKRARKPKVVAVEVEEVVGVGDPEPEPLEGLDELFKDE